MKNNKGSALMQVLLITIVVATIATAILRIAISRTTTAAATVRTISAKNILEGCNAQVQSMLVRKQVAGEDISNALSSFKCEIQAGPAVGDIIQVTAKYGANDTAAGAQQIIYSIDRTSDLQKL
ncbi:MAG: hypothetical protein LBI01_06625 [Elusimicrobium sp.]|jgi:hypothetical protein|nr:hypothetical protein [Elusimicrobium sp.]